MKNIFRINKYKKLDKEFYSHDFLRFLYVSERVLIVSNATFIRSKKTKLVCRDKNAFDISIE